VNTGKSRKNENQWVMYDFVREKELLHHLSGCEREKGKVPQGVGGGGGPSRKKKKKGGRLRRVKTGQYYYRKGIGGRDRLLLRDKKNVCNC